MPLTRRSLEDGEMFAPIGASLAIDGSVEQFAERPADDGLPMKDAVERAHRRMREVVGRGLVRSAAVAADVLIWRRRDGEEASHAVSVHMEHQGGYCVDLLIPYKVRRGLMSRLRRRPQVMFRKMIAQQSDPSFFPGLERRD